ncbi:MAG: 1-acyl-sn-glycerol-3-phosphate acyltransferase [Paludibacteraceae bacterium]|nr:1-acyl-sn-glycerol-3-phosphate acyltransferase [Paludibacteraceae bacterium]
MTKYEQLKVAEGVYVPQMGINYPEDNPYEQLVQPKFTSVFTVDENYPFVDDSFRARMNTFILVPIIVRFLLRLKLRVQMGLRYRGRSILRKYKKELSNGAITIANHCFRLDCPCVLLTAKVPMSVKIPMFAPNFGTKDGFFMKTVGGVPIPEAEAGMTALKKFNEAFDEFHRRGYWMHIFPEAKRWDFYKPLRPFQKGAFTMAYKYDMPLLPCVITFRERTGIFRLFGPKELPLLQCEIGEPIFPDKSQPRATEVNRLLETAHKQMCEMAGIVNNPWPAQIG